MITNGIYPFWSKAENQFPEHDKGDILVLIDNNLTIGVFKRRRCETGEGIVGHYVSNSIIK